MTRYQRLLNSNEALRKKVTKLEADVKGLERFRALRTRHNDEMQLRTTQLLNAEARVKSLIKAIGFCGACSKELEEKTK